MGEVSSRIIDIHRVRVPPSIEMKRGRKYADGSLGGRASWKHFGAAFALAIFGTCAHAQVATDGTLGPRQNLQGPNYVVPPLIGRASGPNLFHSFSTLTVNTGATLTFLGGSGIQNIISRVTGGSASVIDGQIRSASPGVNLFLLNPSGIFFGPNASLNVAASFYASTANHMLFADGMRFSTNETFVPPDTLLPFTAPSGFGFSGVTGPITLTGSQLVIREGFSLGLVANDLRLTNSGTRLSILSALGSTVALNATGGSADIALNGQTIRGVSSGKTELISGTIVAVNEGAAADGSGRIVIRGGDVILERAQLLANSRTGNGRGIDIDAQGTLAMKGARLLSLTTGKGNAGRISIAAGNMLMEDASTVDASCDPGCTTGTGGDIDVRVRGNLLMSTDPKVGQQFIGSNSFGGGKTGRVDISAKNLVMSGASAIQAVALAGGASEGISIAADTIALLDGAQVDTSSRGSGAGGLLTVSARDILIQGDRLEGESLADEKEQLSRLSIPSGFFSNSYGSGNAGTIRINTGNMRIVDGGEISSSVARSSKGNGGNIFISATDELLVTGRSTKGLRKQSAIVSNTFALGDGGSVQITAGRLRVMDRGLIQTQSESSGIAGEIRIAANDMEVIGGQVSSDARAFGRGGAIDIRLTGQLTVARDDPNQFAGIFARAYSAGAGGSIVVAARNAVLRDQGEINAGTIGAGLGGNVSLFLVDKLIMQTGGAIRTNSDALADAGNITINAGGGIDMSGAQILTSAKVADGGNIDIVSAGPVAVRDGSLVSAEVKSGSGTGGNVSVRAGTFQLAQSTLTASAVGGSGGSLSIAATGGLTAVDGKIAAQVSSGTLNGGNVTLSGGAVALSGTQVSANAFAGAGGSIVIQSSGNVQLDKSILRADVSSGTGSGGNVKLAGIAIDLRDTNVSANTFAGNGGGIRMAAIESLTVERSAITATVTAENGAGGNIGLQSGSLAVSDSVVSSSALSGAGGNVDIESRRSAVITSSRVAAEVLTGLGDGGNLNVSGAGLALRNSAISANAFGGRGGNILINADNLLVNRASSVTASSQLGIDGTVAFTSPAADLTGALLSVASSFLDANALIATSCLAPTSVARSRFLIRERIGDQQDPLRYLFPAPAFSPDTPDSTAALTTIAARR